MARAPLIDPYGRRLHYVRLSVTDRCNFRCAYCMPADVEFMPKQHLMRFEELGRLARVLAELGVERIRLTGGEPTVRRGIVQLVEEVAAARSAGLRDLAMTTNGWNLAKIAEGLRGAGLSRLNISIDTLDRKKFEALTGVDRLHDVLDGIEAVIALGWLPLKLNVVVCRGVNEDEVVPLVERFAHLPVTIRFIEYMAFGQSAFPLVPWHETMARLQARWTLTPVDGPEGSGPAAYWRLEGTPVEVGAIGARSRQFCAACNRFRVGADGVLRPCLAWDPDQVNLRDVMRGGGTDDDLETAIRRALLVKPFSHLHQEDGANPFEGRMVTIGG